jgi:ectoine hydroxylase-related dioxygenase (phytanoyl-CoA dioxygenase family)
MKIDIEQYRKSGFIHLRNFFRKEDIKKIYDEAKSVFYKQFVEMNYTNKTYTQLLDQEFNHFLFKLFEDDNERIINCGKQVQHLISLHQLALNKKILLLLNEVGITSPVISTRPVLFFNHPNLAKTKVYHTVDSHQDWRSMQGSLDSVVIWIPLRNISKELGALEILPSSHLHGLRTDYIENGFGMVNLSNEEKLNLVSVEVEAGDILLFSSFLIHQSGINITNEPRWSCHFRYNNLDERTFIERKYAHAYIYKPLEELITDSFPSVNDLKSIFKY